MSALTVPPVYIDIPLDLIEIPEEARKLTQEGIDRLAETIELDGQLEPIGVRPKPMVKDSYILVFGQHRMEAHRKLGHATVTARVFEMDDEEALAASIAENLHRTSLDAAEQGLAVLRWTRIHDAKHHKPAQGTAGGLASQAAAHGKEAPAARESAAKKLAAARGVSEKRIANEFSVLKKLGEEALTLLKGCGCQSVDLAKLAAIKDDAVREQAIDNIIGIAGVTVDGAIAMASTPRGSTDDDTGTVNPERGKVLTDEEWIDQECVAILRGLKHQVAFRKDAALYRQTAEIRRKFENAMRHALDASGGQVDKCGFYRDITRVVTVEHPKHWLVCGKCSGTGKSGGFPCQKCRGTAYEVNFGETR
jgi:ParB-like chromosome segregation protein Spo0J